MRTDLVAVVGQSPHHDHAGLAGTGEARGPGRGAGLCRAHKRDVITARDVGAAHNVHGNSGERAA